MAAAATGILYCLLWYASILAGYVVLYCPALPLLVVSNKLYRFYTDAVFALWQYYPTVLLDKLCGCKVTVYGDPIRSNETSILIMNHRTRTDWNFLWPCLYYATEGKNRYRYSTKFIMKDAIRHVPGSGWSMQLSLCLYIKRNWTSDKYSFAKVADYIASLNYKCCLMLFPEGTDMTPRTKRNSDRFAEKNNLKIYDHVLHPRTTGFTFLTETLIKNQTLDAVYDVTLLYPDKVPQTEKEVLSGNIPEEVKFHIKRYATKDLPTNQDDLKIFLERLWENKEEKLREYNATKAFYPGSKVIKRDHPMELMISLIFWTVLPFIAYFLISYFESFRRIIWYHTLFIIGINFFICGFQQLEISVHEFKKRISNYWN